MLVGHLRVVRMSQSKCDVEGKWLFGLGLEMLRRAKNRSRAAGILSNLSSLSNSFVSWRYQAPKDLSPLTRCQC